MKEPNPRIDELVSLSRWLGDPERDCAVLGEGNTSTRLSDRSFLVKASGTELGTIRAEEFLEIDFGRALRMLEEDADDSRVAELLNESKIDASSPLRPSVETAVHAACLSVPGVEYVGHTHPIAINAITCSARFEEALRVCLFPDQIVVCGAHPLILPYIDPGLPLARELRARLDEYLQEHGRPPRTIYLQNHGVIALGATVKQVQAITTMAIKAARIHIGAIACGGVHPMSEESVRRIDGRSDEHYRQRIIESGAPG